MIELEKLNQSKVQESTKQYPVEYTATGNLAALLEGLNISLLISTYQVGKLISVGSHDSKLVFDFHTFDRVMGVAIGRDRLAIGGRRQIYFLKQANELASKIEPAGTYDSCWLARSSFITGSIHGHDLACGSDGLWVVNTLFSCLCTLSGEFISNGLRRPHSPRVHCDKLRILNSGKGEFGTVDRVQGGYQTIPTLPENTLLGSSPSSFGITAAQDTIGNGKARERMIFKVSGPFSCNDDVLGHARAWQSWYTRKVC